MSAIGIGMMITKVASNIGTSAVVANAFRAYIPKGANLAMRICVEAGAVGASGALALATDKYFDKLGDELEEVAKSFKKVMKKEKKVEEEEFNTENAKDVEFTEVVNAE